MPSPADLLFDGVAACAAALARGEVTSTELVEATLARIDAVEPHLNAFRAVWTDQARAGAGAADEARAAGDERPLLGVPIALKDDLDVAGEVTGHGSRSCGDPARHDAEVVRRLRSAGVVAVGKTNMPEFGQWAFTESDLHGITRNPWDLDRTPGGSSGGSAAAVAAGIVPAAMGSDGGGSIRIPAACCGLFGMKVTRGRISPAPEADLWNGLAVVGPLTRTVGDSALLHDVLRGNLPDDRYRCDDPPTSFVEAAAARPRPLRIALSTRSTVPGIPIADQMVAAAESVAATLAELGHQVDIYDQRWPEPLIVFATLGNSGIRAHIVHAAHPDQVEPATEIHLGPLQPPALAERWGLRRAVSMARRANRVFDQHDLLLTPALGGLPKPAGGLGHGGAAITSLRNLWAVPFTTLWNVCGNPAATVPAGFTPGGVPLSVQLVAPMGDECTIFSVAAQLEAARPWADRRPTLPG